MRALPLRRRRRSPSSARDEAVTGILREAQAVGLRSMTKPSLADVERRRTQVWTVAGGLVVALALAAAVLLASGAEVGTWISGTALAPSLALLATAVTAYGLEKERHLRRLTRLLLTERTVTTALTDRLHEISSLLEAGAAVNSVHELDTVLDIILSSAMELLGGSGASIMRREGERLRCVSATGDGDLVDSVIRVGEGTPGRVARMRQALLITGQHASGGAPARPSTMSVPLLDRGELLGVLTVYAAPGRQLSEYDMRAVSLFAEAAAAAVSKADLLEATRRHSRELEQLAFHDTLTGLPNRALLSQQAEHALARTRAGHGLTALLYLDLDGFKGVNDRLGHATGDALLRAFAERLRGCLRTGAVAGRLGGDEFAVLMPDLTDPAVATVVAERILASAGRPFSVDGHQVVTGASVGIAVAGPRDGELGWDELARRADLAMYDAKRTPTGRRIRSYDARVHTAAALRRHLDVELTRALDHDELVLHFQPAVSLVDGSVTGAEALVRWEHPERGLLAPDSFVPAAVENGLIVPIGGAVLTAACRQLARWRGELGPLAPAYVAVNVSARQLESGRLLEQVDEALAAAGLDPGSLVLELTEDALVREGRVELDALDELRSRGVRVAIDDFGSRYSSLNYLLRLPVDILKIDRSFVEALATTDRGGAMVETVVALSRRLDLDTVAEGVETAEQAEQLLALGCRQVQGYRFARPLPAADLRALLAGGAHPLAGLVPAPRQALAGTRPLLQA